MASRELRDPIHGFILRNDVEEQIINSPAFQRLRRIKQLAFAFLVYPGAMHTRFEHSVGAMHVAGKMAESLELDPDEKRLVRLATLLHDIGHGPFSHVSEPVLDQFSKSGEVDGKSKDQIHERVTRRIILEDKTLSHILSGRDRDQIVGILDGSFGDTLLKQIVSGPLDADKQDYLLRDSYFCGVRYGVYDLGRLSGTLAVHKDSDDRYLAVTEDGVHALEQFVLAKYYMTTQVYRHKVRLITDSMVRRALELGIRTDKIGWLKKLYSYKETPSYLKEYKTWTDDRLINEILSDNTENGYAKSLFQHLVNRCLHKQVATYPISAKEFVDPLVRDRLSGLNPKDKHILENEIASYLSVDPNLVIVNSFTIKSVREQAKNSEAFITVLSSEQPKKFDEVSTLFQSIDAAIGEAYVEIYAPVHYKSDKQKRQLKVQYQREIREIINKTLLRELKKGKGGQK